MSTLLKEAIIDAAALKEAALKNAEASIIEKYSAEVKEQLNRLLEQEDPAAGLGDLDLGADTAAPETELDADASDKSSNDVVGDEVPLAALDGIEGGTGVDSGSSVEFDVNIDTLQEAIRALSDELNEDVEYDIDENDLQTILEDIDLSEDAGEEADLADILSEDDMTVGASAGEQSADEAEAEEKEFEGSDEGGLDEEIDTDTLLDAVMERLTVDMGATLSGWAGRSSESQKWEMEKELAHRRSTDMQDELDVLRKAQEELVFENKQLKEQITQYEQATQGLKEGLQDVNLSNARLLYTNRVLRNTSLNERQKDKIVEAISHAGSVTEARTIFDTLQSTVESTPKRGPQSLSEAITRNRSSVIRASRHERPSSDPLQERMKRLAGIK
tara:strand:- start:55 stop:1218 length:1164 start_codon:yes stop_codon:yes gene_type:complete